MVVIRLSPHGRKGDKVYKITVCSKAAKLTGKYIEKLGIYKPGMGKDVVNMNVEKYTAWVAKGAQPSATLVKVLRDNKLISAEAAPKAAAPKAPKAEKKAAPAKAAAPKKATSKK